MGDHSRGGIVSSINSTMHQSLTNNYYLNTIVDYGILGFSNSNFELKSNNNKTPLTLSQMPSIISVINGYNVFVADTNNINNGYPILRWKVER